MAPTAAATHEQIEALLNFMVENNELARGLLRGADGRARSKRVWENLCNSLNSMGGCTKSVEQWQRVWSDKKHLAKKAAGAARRSASATGGGPSVVPTLSQVELKILSIMGEGFGEPQTGARVPAFPLLPPVTNPEPAATSPAHTATPADPLSQEQASTSTEAQEPAQVAQWTPSGVALASPEMPIQNQLNRSSNPLRRRSRIRRHLPADARSRIVEVEEKRLILETRRNEVLGEIKVAIVELCSLVREHLNNNNS